MQSLCQSKITSISQWCLNKFLTNTEILETIKELTVSQLDVKLFEGILLLGVEIESHVVEPGEVSH